MDRKRVVLCVFAAAAVLTLALPGVAAWASAERDEAEPVLRASSLFGLQIAAGVGAFVAGVTTIFVGSCLMADEVIR